MHEDAKAAGEAMAGAVMSAKGLLRAALTR
jgi:hypothetical protein